jgi:hypothetical protein
MSAETSRALELLHPDTRIIELRPIMPDGRWWSGYFDDRQALLRAVDGLNAIEAKAVYWSVNPILPTLADRVTNKVGPAKKGCCTRNKDIERIKWLFLDLDSKGGATLDLAEKIRAYLSGRGWEAPHLISSGTGNYLFYPVDLHPQDAKIIKRVVKTLADRFDSEESIVDKKCANPGRIARVPGSYNRKDGAALCRFLEEVAANG